MSHITAVSLKILDLRALRAAVQEMGAQFIEGKTTYNWWGISVGNKPIPKGMTKEMLGRCSHVIKVPGVNYEIGVVKTAQGHYTLAYDAYNWGHGPNNIPADGGKLEEKFGQGLKKLVQSYAVAKATLEARAKGWMVVSRQTLANGSVKVVMQGV